MRHSRGFSLLELVVSLAILAALATVAMRSANNLQSQTYYQVTTNSLNEIRNALVGVPNQRGPDGSVQITGFVADTGRLPKYATGGDTATPPDPFNELLQPNGIPAYGFVASNTDPAVLMGAGWNGPYVRLGAGPSYLRDGWGNLFRVYDAGGSAVTVAGNPIYQIASGGADNTADSNHGGSGDASGYNADVSIPNAANLSSGGFVTTASLYGRVTMNLATDTLGPNTGSQSGPAPSQTYTYLDTSSVLHTSVPVSIWVCYYGPDLTATPRPVVDLPVQITDTVNWQFAVSDPKLTIGPRVLKAYVVDSAVVTNATQFRTAVASAPNPKTGPVFFVSTLRLTAVGGGQNVPDFVLPHYAP